MVKLSIIIPAYKAEPYIYELFDCLAPQITDEVEVMVIDDGSPEPVMITYPWIQLHRQPNSGVSVARNYGIEHTTGEYIAFIDADDLVAENYIATLLHKIETEHFDYIELSWKSLPGPAEQYTCKLNSFTDKMQNPSACTRAFKRSFIGNVRFNTKKVSSEDENFTRMLDFKNGKRAIATEFMYFYRTNNPNSKSHRFWRGELETKQIVYHYRHVTKDMTWLIEEIKKEDEHNCVWLLTEQNDLPELEKYCRVRQPHRIRGMELRGEPTPFFTKVEVPKKVQIVLYLSKALEVSGINTFLYNFCAEMPFKTMVLYDEMNEKLIRKLSKVTDVRKNDTSKVVECEALIMNSIFDKLPGNIKYGKSIRVCHACSGNGRTVPNDCDHTVYVSNAAMKTWGVEGTVINNITHSEANSLLLVSATRINSLDKGDHDKRMRQFAELLNREQISYVWLNFSDRPLPNPPENFINAGPCNNVQSVIKKADYLVQLSSQEAFCYSIAEAIELSTPVITCNMEVLPELKVADGVNGYVVPEDLNFDVRKLLDIPTFNYKYDKKKVIKQWKKLLEESVERKATNPKSLEPGMVRVKVLKNFKDVHTGMQIPVGEATLSRKRVEEILKTQNEKKIKLIEVLS